MTVSFHITGDSGDITDVGVGRGKYYSLNAVLKPGLNDECFHHLFKPVIYKAMEIYQPDVIVLQSGADSLAPIHDYAFNLSIKGHGRCLHYIKSFDVPLMVLGGRGSLEDVRNCWPYETAIALGIEEHQFPEKVMTSFSRRNVVADLNTTRDIESIKNRLQMHPRSISEKNTEAVDYESESDEEWHFLG